MNIEIDAKISGPTGACERMQERIKNFPELMAAELVTWQVQDMNRKYPNVERPDQMTAETEIWPRSRRPRPYIRHGQRGAPRGHRPPIRTKPLRKRRVPSTRPILREALLQKLRDRVNALIATLTWKP